MQKLREPQDTEPIAGMGLSLHWLCCRLVIFLRRPQSSHVSLNHLMTVLKYNSPGIWRTFENRAFPRTGLCNWRHKLIWKLEKEETNKEFVFPHSKGGGLMQIVAQHNTRECGCKTLTCVFRFLWLRDGWRHRCSIRVSVLLLQSWTLRGWASGSWSVGQPGSGHMTEQRWVKQPSVKWAVNVG